MIKFDVKMEEGKAIDVSVNEPSPIQIDVKAPPVIKPQIYGTGPRGKSGGGTPSGGLRDQILKKKSLKEHDAEWVDFDYNGLLNKPSIEGVPLVGDTSFPMLNLNALSNTELENLLTI